MEGRKDLEDELILLQKNQYGLGDNLLDKHRFKVFKNTSGKVFAYKRREK